MKKRILFIVCALMAMMVDAQEVKYLTTEEFKTQVMDYTTQKEWLYTGEKPCVIDFYTTWCGPCKRLAPIMETLAKQYAGEVVFYKVDTERERELAAVFGINSIPQMLFIPLEGRPTIVSGLRPQEDIEKFIDSFLLNVAK